MTEMFCYCSCCCRPLHSDAALWTRVCPRPGHPAWPPLPDGELPASALWLPPVRLLPGWGVYRAEQGTKEMSEIKFMSVYLVQLWTKGIRVHTQIHGKRCGPPPNHQISTPCLDIPWYDVGDVCACVWLTFIWVFCVCVDSLNFSAVVDEGGDKAFYRVLARQQSVGGRDGVLNGC